MNKFILILFTATLILKNENILIVKLEDLKNSKGNILIQLYNDKQEVVDQKITPLTSNSCKIIFKNLKQGKYAVRYFHDENNNKKLDFEWYGAPKEGYGYSNNAKGVMGEPPFEKWLFELNDNKEIKLITQY